MTRIIATISRSPLNSTAANTVPLFYSSSVQATTASLISEITAILGSDLMPGSLEIIADIDPAIFRMTVTDAGLARLRQWRRLIAVESDSLNVAFDLAPVSVPVPVSTPALAPIATNIPAPLGSQDQPANDMSAAALIALLALGIWMIRK